MRRILSALALLWLCVAVVTWAQTKSADVKLPASPTPAVAPLTETERLLLENHTLRFRLMLQAMSAERADLTKRILASRPGVEIDWDKLELRPIGKPAERK